MLKKNTEVFAVIFFYEGVIRLPFILYYKGWLPQSRITLDKLALNIDIAPTLLDVAGEIPSPAMKGQSL